MRAQKLDRTLICYRIGDLGGVYPIFDATGSRLSPGRWNTPASPMIYASEHYSTAMLEKLADGAGELPPNQHFIKITIPRGAAYEMLNAAALPDWHAQAGRSSKPYGEAWHQGKRSLILIVPAWWLASKATSSSIRSIRTFQQLKQPCIARSGGTGVSSPPEMV